MGGAFKRPPPAGGGKSRGPAGRGLKANNSTIVVVMRMKINTQVCWWRPVIVLEFQRTASNGERVARESLKLLRLWRCHQSYTCVINDMMFIYHTR